MPVSRTELVVALAITIVGFAARFALLDQLAIEHFDEGVYASNLWFPDEGFQYPDRFLYAPPLVPSLIEWSMLLFIPARWAAFLPSLILGSLTVPLAWWSLRRWSNGPAGIAAAALVALSDFHIAMSRSALTDAPLVFFLLLAVWLTIESLSKSDLRLAAMAGFATGLAWATKYNGWLPIAIALSGAIVAWLLQPRINRQPEIETRRDPDKDSTRLSSILLCLAVLILAAAAIWSPVWWDLQPTGGYSRVADNHQNYVTGFAEWWPAAVRHEVVQRHYAGWPTLLSGWLAVAAAAFVLRVERSTWNDLASVVNLSTFGDAARSTASVTTADRSTWNDPRFLKSAAIAGALAGAVVLSPLMALGIWSLTELVASAVTLRRNGMRRLRDSQQDERSVKSHPQATATSTDARRWFGLWLHLAWLCGLILATPLYRPYPRLILPLLCVGWLATGIAIVRLLRGSLVSGKSDGRSTGKSTVDAGHPWQRLRFIWLVPVVFLCVWHAVTHRAGAWQERSALAVIAEQAIATAAASCKDEPEPNSNINPHASIDFVMYVYGEPGLFFHIPRDGVPVQPVTDLNFAKRGSTHTRVPTFVLAGPHAWKSPQFGTQFREVEETLTLVAVFPYELSDFVLLDDYAPRLLSRHRKDDVRLFRVRFE
ncbi:MAG: glycosyltransferase family 39 protein [Planctomycetota bacterium]|nr:glycosyltransferase family 39 protein [Planctomycetota bacterium]MDA1162219.1 glycosyltransferase family 39 protein [Planctomycetota bacterium]